MYLAVKTKMRFLVCAAFLCVGLASAAVTLKHPQYREGDRYFLASDKDGNPIIVDLEEPVDPDYRFTPEQDVKLRLFTRRNPTNAQVITSGNAGTLGNFDKSKGVKIVAHGWNNDGNSEIMSMVRDAFLATADVNVICVDWGVGANVGYPTAVGNVRLVGKFLGGFIDWLISQGASIGNFHVMGHSLGGHVAGITARSVTRGKIPYVTGFDPAMPLWGSGTDRIRPSDGNYVEIIHTNSGNLGLADPVGHNDFYPNGGTGMPGCSVVDVGCSHGRSYQYFADSLDHTRFQSNQCRDYNEALNNQCSNLSKLHMGGASPKAARGPFHLTTNANKPYYKG